MQIRTSFEAVSTNTLEPNELRLTSKGMSSVNWDSSDADFEFLCGGDKICVHSVLAEFLSPKVALVRKGDPFCSSYTFKDREMFGVFGSLVSSLRSGDPLPVEKSNFVTLLRLSQELENDDLFSSLVRMIETESLSLEEAIFLLRVGVGLGTAFSDQFGNLRDFVASCFYKLDKEILDNLDLETTQILLSSRSLQIEDEDSLYDFIRSRSEKDLRFTALFEFIYFDYLSISGIENFASFVSENFLENISSGIWRQICRRLILDVKPVEKKNPRGHKGREFVYDESRKLDGVIAYLTRECGGNVHEKGLVHVVASSVLDGDGSPYQPKNAVDLGTNSYYASKDEQNSWICYDFKDRRVIPTSYSVRSYGAASGGDHPKSWVIEVSNDGTENSWTEIDRRDNNDLNYNRVTVNFKISQLPSESFRFFRLRHTGKNHNGNNYLILSSLEIFGTLCRK